MIGGVLPGLVGVAGLAASIAIGLIFVTDGIEKQRQRESLAGVIANYRLLPDRLTAPAARILPPFEIALGLMLLSGIAPLTAAGIAAATLLLFAAAMGINVARGRTQISCGCGHGALAHRLGWGLVARNLILVGLLGLRLLPATPLMAIDVATAAAAGIGAFLGYVLVERLGAFVAAPALASRR